MLEKYYLINGNICVQRLHQITPEENQFIIENTKYLLVDAALGQRLKLIKMGITEHPLCRGCGKPLPISKTKGVAFNDVCSVQCVNRGIDLTDKVEKFKQTISKNKAKNVDKLENAIILPKEQVIEFFEKHLYVFKGGGSKGKSLLDDNPDYYKSLIAYTHEYKKFNGRIYELLYGIGKCKVCGEPTTFYSLNKGFANHCDKHYTDAGKDIKSKKCVRFAVEMIMSSENYSEFTIIKIPLMLNDNFILYHDKCNKRFNLTLNNGKSSNYTLHCPYCNSTSISLAEKEICRWLEENNVDYIPQYLLENKRLDIYIAEFNLAIEHHGPDHSFGKDDYKRFDNHLEENTNKNFHLDRHNLCKENGIRLIHIFTSDWSNKMRKEIWKSILGSKLNLNTIVYGRKCIIKEVDTEEATTFLNKNHLQGNCPAGIKLGLYKDNELVSIMTFGKPRNSTKHQYELIRFCNKLHHNVIGGASKLFNYFIKNYNPDNIISYCHMHIFDGELYEKLGFEYSHSSKPSYWYHKNNITLSRYQCQKHKLHKILRYFDVNKSEAENMFDNGYRRMWDCGNKVFVWRNNNV